VGVKWTRGLPPNHLRVLVSPSTIMDLSPSKHRRQQYSAKLSRVDIGLQSTTILRPPKSIKDSNAIQKTPLKSKTPVKRLKATRPNLSPISEVQFTTDPFGSIPVASSKHDLPSRELPKLTHSMTSRTTLVSGVQKLQVKMFRVEQFSKLPRLPSHFSQRYLSTIKAAYQSPEQPSRPSPSFTVKKLFLRSQSELKLRPLNSL
jgi:hypothetical protein